jgi:hypothetical protein
MKKNVCEKNAATKILLMGHSELFIIHKKSHFERMRNMRVMRVMFVVG